MTKSNNLIENNHVYCYGCFQRTGASGIFVRGCGQIVRHNSIHDAPHMAVLYGGNEHLFEYNEVYRVVMETGDAGAVVEGKAEKLNYKEPPWSERYPRLARIMEDSPQEPLYNPILNNVFVDCKKDICRFDANVMKLPCIICNYVVLFS